MKMQPCILTSSPFIHPSLAASTSTMTESIPRTQTAAVVTSKDEDIQIRLDFPVKQPHDLAPGECLIKIEATGVCHSGQYTICDQNPSAASRN